MVVETVVDGGLVVGGWWQLGAVKGCCCCGCWGDGVPGSEQLVLCSERDGREGAVCVLPSPRPLAHCPRDPSTASDAGIPMLVGAMSSGGGMCVLEMLQACWFDPGSEIVVSGSV